MILYFEALYKNVIYIYLHDFTNEVNKHLVEVQSEIHEFKVQVAESEVQQGKLNVQACETKMQDGVPKVQAGENKVQQGELEVQFEADFTTDVNTTESEIKLYIKAKQNIMLKFHVDDVQIDAIDLEQDDEYEKGIWKKFKNSENEQEKKYTHG